MGEVYLVEHAVLAEQFAIKLIFPHLSEKPGFLERFKREARGRCLRLQQTSFLTHAQIVLRQFSAGGSSEIFLDPRPLSDTIGVGKGGNVKVMGLFSAAFLVSSFLAAAADADWWYLSPEYAIAGFKYEIQVLFEGTLYWLAEPNDDEQKTRWETIE